MDDCGKKKKKKEEREQRNRDGREEIGPGDKERCVM